MNAVKREFIDDQSSMMQPPSLTSPSIRQDNKRISPKHEDSQDDTVLFQIYPTFKPRSKAIAKKLLQERRVMMKGKEQNSDSESEITEVFKSPKNKYIRGSYKTKKSAAAANNVIKLNQVKEKEEDCHMCEHQIDSENAAVCSVEGCNKGYCLDCIHQIYQKDFDLESYNPECWICYSCGGTCECAKCKRRRPTVRKNQDAFRLQEELLAMQSLKKGATTNKINEKRKMKYYDMSSDEENDYFEQEDQSSNFEPPMKNIEAEEVFPVPKVERRGRKKKIKTEVVKEEVVKEEVVKEKGEKIERRGRKKKVVKKEEEIKEEAEQELEIEEEEDHHEIEEEKEVVKKSPAMDKGDIDDSKIISEVSIDYACITLYDAENEEELKNQVQMKFENEMV